MRGGGMFSELRALLKSFGTHCESEDDIRDGLLVRHVGSPGREGSAKVGFQPVFDVDAPVLGSLQSPSSRILLEADELACRSRSFLVGQLPLGYPLLFAPERGLELDGAVPTVTKQREETIAVSSVDVHTGKRGGRQTL